MDTGLEEEREIMYRKNSYIKIKALKVRSLGNVNYINVIWILLPLTREFYGYTIL